MTVAAEAEHGGVAGEAVNLSEGGACVAIDDAIFDVGDELILYMHFAQPARTVPATARVPARSNSVSLISSTPWTA